MPHFLDSIINQYGKPVPSVTCAVYLAGTNTLATIYSDEQITQIPNPTQADPTGQLSFWAVAGNYDLHLSGGSPAINAITVTVTVGASGAGTGFTQAKTVSTGSIDPGEGADVVITWDVPFSNATYKVTTSLVDSGGGLRILQIKAVTTNSITVRVVNDDDTNANTGTVYALAF